MKSPQLQIKLRKPRKFALFSGCGYSHNVCTGHVMGAETAVVVGGSIAGLCAALALQDKGFQVTVVERDEAPDPGITAAESTRWQRRGAVHTMQPHFFLAGLRNVLHAAYPELCQELLAAGVKEIELARCIHPSVRHRYRIQPNDDQLTFFAARRSTFELAMYRHVRKRAQIGFLDNTQVTGLLMKDGGPPFVIHGVRLQEGPNTRELQADIVVDCSGRSSKLIQQAVHAGAVVEDFLYKSKSAYYTRHYRLLPGQHPPEFAGLPSVLFDDIVVVTFIADNGTFVMSLVVNQDDPQLFGSFMNDPEVFETVVRRFPKAARWIEPQRAVATTPVLAWANMDFFWRTTVHRGIPQLLGYFPVGDTIVRSNPKFGRGCTWAITGAQFLATAIAQERDPAARVHRYERHIYEAFRSDWEIMLDVDRQDQERFKIAAGLAPSGIKAKLLSRLQHQISNIAVTVDPQVYREVVRGFYGITSPVAWTRRPGVWLRVAAAALLPNAGTTLAKRFAERPSRAELRAIIDRKHPPA
jgi:2-polyprenyl-6-methoxyphenol hydroxylase-like FAD-dependent oxidoreductase